MSHSNMFLKDRMMYISYLAAAIIYIFATLLAP